MKIPLRVPLVSRAARAAVVLAVIVAGGESALWGAEKERPTGVVGPVVKNVDVSITNLDVVVTDSKGKRVTGLRKEDFDVIEDGYQQILTNFYAVEGGMLKIVGDDPAPALTEGQATAAPAKIEAGIAEVAPLPVLKTRIVIFIDNLHIAAYNRNRVLRNIEAFVRANVKDNTEAMVVTWERSLKVLRKFTNDGRDVADVLKQVEEISAQGSTRISERQDVLRAIDDSRTIDEAVSRIRQYVLAQKNDLDFTVEALKTAVNQLAGVEGKKIFLHVSDGLPQSPGYELWLYAQGKYQSQSLLLNAQEFDKTAGFLGVIRNANAAGVTIYTVDAAGLSVDSSVSAENRTTGSVTSMARLDSFAEKNNEQAMLSLMSEETGGAAILNKNDITLALNELERDCTSYYSLGYRSLRSGADRPHKVDVRVKRKGLTARARRSYLEKSAETRITEATLSALVFPRADNPLAAGLETGTPAPADRENFLVPFRIRIPFSRITLLPDGPKLKGRLIVYFVVLDSNGKQSDLAQQSIPVEVDAKAFDSFSKKDFIYDARLLMIPGGQRISIAVRDDLTNAVSYIQKSIFVSVFSGQAGTSGPKP
jgi:VWFA-related protein